MEAVGNRSKDKGVLRTKGNENEEHKSVAKVVVVKTNESFALQPAVEMKIKMRWMTANAREQDKVDVVNGSQMQTLLVV